MARNRFEQVTGEAQRVNVIDHIEYPESGGIYVYLKGVLYPTKGFPTPESVGACNIVKRHLIIQVKFLADKLFYPVFIYLALLPKGIRITLASKWANEFDNFASVVLEPYLLKDERYTPFAQELRKFLLYFLMELEISKWLSLLTSKILATLLEYDTAYRFRLQDLLSETTKEDIMRHPRKELKRLLNILSERDERVELNYKFRSAGKILSLALLVPSLKRAFINSLNGIDFTKLQMDEADHYHCLKFAGYNFFGRTIEDRFAEYIQLHNGNIPEMINIQGSHNNASR